MQRGKTVFVLSLLGGILCPHGLAQVTVRESLSSNEVEQNLGSAYTAISADGRYVAFASMATNLVPGDTNDAIDIFVRDRILGTTERVNVSSSGAQSDGSDFFFPRLSISADGRFVMFTTNATNLVVPADTNGQEDVYLRDRQLGITERMSVDSSEVGGNGRSQEHQSSADGRFVVFRSDASNLVPNDTNGRSDIFVRDRQLGTTTRVSVASGGVQSNSNSQNVAITADGRYVFFTSYADNLVGSDFNGNPDIFVHDRQAGATTRVSMGVSGQEPDASCNLGSISPDGRFVAFQSDATNLVPNDTNNLWDSFVLDRQTGITERISVSTGGVQAGSWFVQYPAPFVSADGRYALFMSDATNLIPNDTNNAWDVFLRDLVLGTTTRVSVGTESVEGNGLSMDPWISPDGRFISFSSAASNFAMDDLNQDFDVFVRDMAPTGFTSLCDPGVAGVVACPCSNPPSGPGRGCDNSSATGGAALSASGIAYVTMDSLRFTTSSERPTALSVLTQWTGGHATGIAYGQGVGCTSGTFRRLYTKSAVGGSITAPDALLGEPSVTSRSAALGSVITAGESRWYIVFYRDPIVLGGCAATRTFNVTQTSRIDWSL